MRRLMLPGLLGSTLLICSCATPLPNLPAAPRVEMPAEAARPCALFLLPQGATIADLEIGFAARGAQVASCNAARDLAVRTHEAEHELEDRLKAKPAR